MPRLLEGTEISGMLRTQIADQWGLSAPVAVAAGGGDNAAGAFGVGVIDLGQAVLSLGTSGVIFAADDHFRSNPERAMHAFCHCIPGRWHEMSVMLSAAACVEWVAKIAGYPDVDAALNDAERDVSLRSAEIFLPYLSGERTPHNDPAAKGVFFGLSHDTTSASLVRAVLEGVAFGLADGLDALREAGVQLERISVIGGGARSSYWGRILAAALRLPLDYRSGAELGPAYGAARLARLALSGEAPDSIGALPPLTRTIEPEAALMDSMQPNMAAFREIYLRLKSIFPKTRLS
jgi:xylulokinase